jgi:diacylglycerol kinase (ATP)
VANPASGGGTDPGAIGARLRDLGAEVSVVPPDELDASSAVSFDRIAVAGGDGTVGPAARAAGTAGVPLAVIPAGTANDFARRMGLPLDVGEACEIAVRGAGRTPVDLASADGRPFVNVANAGLAVRAAREAVPWKRRLGPLAYAVGAAIAATRAHPLQCRVVCDGEELFAGAAWQVMISNSGAFGAGATIAEADHRDGLLDATVIPAGPRVALLRHGVALRRGTVGSHVAVRQARARRIDVDVPSGTAFTIDGEVEPLGPASFEVTPRGFVLVTA